MTLSKPWKRVGEGIFGSGQGKDWPDEMAAQKFEALALRQRLAIGCKLVCGVDDTGTGFDQAERAGRTLQTVQGGCQLLRVGAAEHGAVQRAQFITQHRKQLPILTSAEQAKEFADPVCIIKFRLMVQGRARRHSMRSREMTSRMCR